MQVNKLQFIPLSNKKRLGMRILQLNPKTLRQYCHNALTTVAVIYTDKHMRFYCIFLCVLH
jgi:hypothetical protein